MSETKPKYTPPKDTPASRRQAEYEPEILYDPYGPPIDLSQPVSRRYRLPLDESPASE